MKDHFEVIRALTREEFSRFGEFLHSPIFNTAKRNQDYHAFISRNYKKYKESGISKEYILKYYFKASTLTDISKAETNYRKLISAFNNLLENYLTFLEIERDETASKIKLLRSYRQRGLTKRFDALASELNKHFNHSLPMTHEDYLVRRKYNEELRLNTFSTDYHSSSPVIRSESDAIDLMFVSDKLGAYQNMFSLEYVNKNNKHDWTFFDSVSGYIENNISQIKKYHPSIFFNYAIIKLVKDPSDIGMYYDVKSFLDHNQRHIPPKRLKRFTFDLINYCYLKVNEGNPEFRKEIHSLIIFLDENNLLLADGDINHSYFKSTIDNATTLRELDWLEYFVKKYSVYIEPQYRDNLTNLAYTKLYLYKGEYDKARHYEKNINYKDYIHYIDSKLTLAVIEYESENNDSVYSILDSVKKYLYRNNDISEYYCFFYKNFIAILTDLIKIKEKTFTGIKTEFELEKLKRTIIVESRPFYGKLWLLSKIEQI